jgi:tetratricopeptide (TPR) repeat protein
MRADFAADLLDDPVRAVRIEAARVMAGSPRDKIDAPRRAAFDKAIAEYRQSLVATAERPDSQLLLGILETDVGNYDAAERAYLAAIEAAPLLAPAYINLSDLYRRQHKDSEGERPLRNAIDRMPDNPDLRHALGLLLVREKRLEDALPELQKAATLDTTNARYSYVYGVALHSAGQTEKALAVLEDARRRFPGDRDIAYAVSSLAAEQKMKRKNE